MLPIGLWGLREGPGGAGEWCPWCWSRQWVAASTSRAATEEEKRLSERGRKKKSEECYPCSDLANGSFDSGLGRVKFESNKVRVTQLLFGSGSVSVQVKFGLIEFDFGSVWVRVEFGLG